MDWASVVAERLKGMGFQAVEFAGAPALERSEPWGRLRLLLLPPVALGDAEALFPALAVEVAREAGAGAQGRLAVLAVLPFARLDHQQAERFLALRQTAPDGQWVLIPWVVEREAELVNQHTGWPSVDPRVAAALADPVDEERPGPQSPGRPVAQAAATQWGRPSLRQRLGLGGEFPVIRTLLALNISIYLLMVLLGGTFLTALLEGPDVFTLYRFGATNTHPMLTAKIALMTTFDQPWRLLTSTFLHASGIHILLNMYALWNLGRTVEVVYGARRTIYIYVVSGLLGSIVSVELQTGPSIGVGASGAIMGLLGATIYFALTLRGQGRRVNWSQLLAPVVMTLAYGLMIRGIDNWAHIGGLVGGLVAGFLAGVPGERRAWKPIAAGALGALLASIVVGLVPLIPWLFKPGS